ncbi:MAG: TonB-dependent receptor plug domain-containing protein [Pseudomonadales bacterium]
MHQRCRTSGFGRTPWRNANGGRGANFAGIHQLNPERTLVLYNGRRTVSTIRDSTGLAVDLQSFPVNMIDRVEVLADGASTIYGSDAIAGVINLIPRTDFNGVELSLGGGTPDDRGGDHFDAGLLFGISGDRGFFTAGVTYVFDGDVDFQDRGFSKIPLLGQLRDGGQTLNLVGSGIPPEGRALEAGIIFLPNPQTGESFQAYDTFCLGGGPGSDGSGSIDCILNQGHRFNYNDIPTGVSLINENRNVNFSGVGEYRFDSGVTGYVNVNLAHREGRLNFTPLPVQGAAGRFTDLIQVPFTNPNIPSDALAVIQAARIDTCNDPDQTDPADVAACLTNPNFQMNWRGPHPTPMAARTVHRWPLGAVRGDQGAAQRGQAADRGGSGAVRGGRLLPEGLRRQPDAGYLRPQRQDAGGDRVHHLR